MGDKDLMAVKPATFRRYLGVYTDKLIGKTKLEILKKWRISPKTLSGIIKWGATVGDLNLDNKEKVQVAIDELLLLRRKMKEIYRRALIKERYADATRCLAEMRKTLELEYKLEGLLKIEINKFEDNRKITIVHNMSNDNNKKTIEVEAKGVPMKRIDK